MRSMKKFGTAVAAASALMALFGAGSASAANFDPANTTLPADGTLILHAPPAGTVSCTYRSGIRSAGGDDAFTTTATGTTPAPPTFSGCTTNVSGATGVDVVADAAWTFTATNTTDVDVTNGNATITVTTPLGSCVVTAAAVSLTATWNQAATSLTPAATPFTVTHSGAVCPDITTGTMTGSVSVPGLTIT